MINNQLNREAQDFLLYISFGITKEDIDNKKDIVEKCSKAAYSDLARTIKYTYSTSELNNMKSEVRKDFQNKKEKAISNVSTYIKGRINILACGSIVQFDTWHNKTCQVIQSIMNMARFGIERESLLGEKITFGQSQKWLNMTLKNLWLLDTLPKSISEEYLHAPIDNYILQAVFESSLDNKTLNTKPKETTIKNGNKTLTIKRENKTDFYIISQEGTQSWSRISDYDDYKTVQEFIRTIAKKDNSIPIKWESKKWIEIAKLRSIDSEISNN